MGAATTDKPSYAAGKPVKVSAVLMNGNAAPCNYIVSHLGVAANDATGKEIPSAGVELDYACPDPAPPSDPCPVPFDPGPHPESMTWSAGQPAPGAYSLALQIGQFVSASLTIEIRAL